MVATFSSIRPANIGPPVAFAAGLLLLASGVLHVVVWLTQGDPLSGPISWRKPILFGLSAGVTVLSMGWVAAKIRPRVGDRV